MTEASTSHLSMIVKKRSRSAGATIAIMRSWDSLMRISPAVRVGSRSSTFSRSTCMPESPLEASSEVAHEIPAAPRSWMPWTTPAPKSSRQHSMRTFSMKGSPTWTLGRLAGMPSSKVSEARMDAPPMPSPPVRAPKRTTRFPSPVALARWMSSWRSVPTHRALTRGFPW